MALWTGPYGSITAEVERLWSTVLGNSGLLYATGWPTWGQTAGLDEPGIQSIKALLIFLILTSSRRRQFKRKPNHIWLCLAFLIFFHVVLGQICISNMYSGFSKKKNHYLSLAHVTLENINIKHKQWPSSSTFLRVFPNFDPSQCINLQIQKIAS